MKPGRQGAKNAADGPGDEPHRHVFRTDTEALGAVERIPRRECLKRELQQEECEKNGAHARDIAAEGRTRRVRDRAPCRGRGARIRGGRFANPDGNRRGDGQDRDGGNPVGHLHPEHLSEHQEDDRAHTHLKRGRSRGERSVA